MEREREKHTEKLETVNSKDKLETVRKSKSQLLESGATVARLVVLDHVTQTLFESPIPRLRRASIPPILGFTSAFCSLPSLWLA